MVAPATEARPARWPTERKLTRMTRAEFTTVLARILVSRLYAAAACFVAMVLLAGAGAFARAVSAQDWQVFRTLNTTTLISVSVQVLRHQGELVPVLLGWALLLLATPPGYSLAFRAAAAAAATLGYLGFSPPPAQVTRPLAVISRWLVWSADRLSAWSSHRLSGRSGDQLGWGVIAVLIALIAVGYVLQASAAGVFGRIVHLREAAARGRRDGPARLPAVPGWTRALGTLVLVLLALLAATWAATVIRLAAVHASTHETSYGFQGGLYLGRFLIVLAVLAVGLSLAPDVDRWLLAAMVLVAGYALLPGPLAVPSFLQVPAVPGPLARAGATWGVNAPWAALFVLIPVMVMSHYLTRKLSAWSPQFRFLRTRPHTSR